MTSKASVTRGSSRWAAASRPGLRRQASVHAAISGSAARADDALHPGVGEPEDVGGVPGEDHRRAEPVLRLVVVLHRLHGADGGRAPRHEPERDVLERDAARLEDRPGRRRPHAGSGAVDVDVVGAGRQLAVVEGDAVGADVADAATAHDVLDRAERLDLGRAHRGAAERLRLDVGVDPEEHLVGLEPVGEVLGVRRRRPPPRPTAPGAA